MANVIVQSRVTPELKEDADNLFKQLGISTADAIRLFLQQSINEGGLPFRPKVSQPNAETVKAIEDARAGRNMKSFDSVDALMEDLYADD